MTTKTKRKAGEYIQGYYSATGRDEILDRLRRAAARLEDAQGYSWGQVADVEDDIRELIRELSPA